MEPVKEGGLRFYHHRKEKATKSVQLVSKSALITNKIDAYSPLGSEVFAEDLDPRRKWILDPQSGIVSIWNCVFLTSCLMVLFIDPLHFYLRVVEKSNTMCIKIDNDLIVSITFLRTLADLFYTLNIAVKYRTAYVAPSSRVFGRGELVMDGKKIAKRYLKSDFALDVAVALPIPQIFSWLIVPAIKSLSAENKHNAFAVIVLAQYIARLYLVFSLSHQIIVTSEVFAKTAWVGAAYNLLLCLIASHVIGASWYLLSLDRVITCWRSQCKLEDGMNGTLCHPTFFYCDQFSQPDRLRWSTVTNVFQSCDPDGSIFNYGIFKIALTNDIFGTHFSNKYFYCLWWGFQNLSSYGQNLDTSMFVGETLFSILTIMVGLVLFAHLIGNIQTYLQSTNLRVEEWRLKRRDAENWMRHRQLPHVLCERVREFIQYNWMATQGVDEKSILCVLPAHLHRDIHRHLCWDLVRRVPLFSQMDDQLLDAICRHLVSSLCTKGTYIVHEGDPVTEMLFIIRGSLDSSTTDGGRADFFNSITLRPGDFCGEELVEWALLSKSTGNFPASTRSVRALVEVEAFALHAEDLKLVAKQFRVLHSKRMQDALRFYSHHWRTWAACFIQAAWQRYKRQKGKNRLWEPFELRKVSEAIEKLDSSTKTESWDQNSGRQRD
ncbi:cyclic nucleotide-gated ion channel 17-like [Zingiber officinale]|uniref:Cyclic nucleotide-binding domain-containing protein n=1 Tax=Zingiber officinale TaxID=94328 RepID=A0A8J5LCM4_ZINOF|nr:cyclic nucleotide-gated ion channel 17-like [Zingiber officinale]KAG6508222.1 hypothetical protein ZIOFF_033594 [Zingiber officinale]